MWYKEWLSVRAKFALAAVLMFGVVLLRLSSTSLNWTTSHDSNSSHFPGWTGIAIFLTILIGMIGGADLFSAEKDQNTFSFLLAKPVSRFKVFAVKVGMNAAAIGAVVVGSNLTLVFFDNLPRMVNYQEITYYIDNDGCASWVYGPTTLIPAVGTSLGAALPAIAASVVLGWATLSVTALISLITSNVLHTCVLSLKVITFLGIGLVGATTLIVGINALVQFYNPNIAFVYMGILATLTFGILVLGARIFTRKEL